MNPFPKTAPVKRIRTAYGPKLRTAIRFKKHTPTKQSFKRDCDINQIMAKFQKTGVIAHVNRHAGEYGFASSNDFTESMQIVTKAQAMFDDLPSSIRSKFANQPELFLAFVQDPDNLAEMQTMGLLSSEAEARRREPVKASEPDPQPPAGSSKPEENAEKTEAGTVAT